MLGMTAGPQLLLLLPSELQLLSCWPRSAAGTWGGREAAAAAPLQPWAGCSPPPELCNKPEPAVLVWSVPAGEGMGLLALSPAPELCWQLGVEGSRASLRVGSARGLATITFSLRFSSLNAAEPFFLFPPLSFKGSALPEPLSVTGITHISPWARLPPRISSKFYHRTKNPRSRLAGSETITLQQC